MKILLVDDKPENLYLLEKILQGNGYGTFSAANGAEALDAALKDPPDIVVSDILMPVMDGFTLCREWRRNKILKKIPFVFYTATYTDPKDKEFALSLGADRFIIKPQEINVLLDIIKESLDLYKTKIMRSTPASQPEERVFLKEYNEALVRKLEDKMTQLETVEKELREKNAALEKDIEKRKQAEEKLLQTQMLLRSSLDSPMDMIIMSIDRNYRYLYFNKVHKAVMKYAYNKEIEIGMNVLDCITIEEDWRNAKSNYDRAMAGESHTNIKEFGDVNRSCYESFFNPIFNEKNEIVGMTAFARDITQRKRIEQELQNSEKRLASILDTVGDVVFLLDVEKDGEYRFASVNQMFLKTTGLPLEAVVGKRVREIIPEPSLSMVLRYYGQAIQERSIIRWEETSDYPTGRLIGEVSIAPLFDEDGNCIHLIGTVHDITERKLTEEALRESERRLSEAQKMAQLGHWSWDVRTGNVEWSEEVFSIFQLNPKEFTPQINSILDLSPWPEDHERDKELIRRAMESHEKGTYEQRFLRPDKSIGYYISSFQGKYDDKNNLISIIGTVQDITERKRADEVLRQKTALLEAQLNSSIDGIIIVDSQGKKIIQNQRTIELWNIPKHIVENEDDQMQVQHVMHMTKDPDQFVKKITDLYNHPNETSRDEVELTDGRILDRYSAPVLGADGKNYGRIWSFRDMTERKRMEKALQERDIQFKKLAAQVPGMIYQFMLKPDGTFCVPFSSDGIRDIFGCSPQDVHDDFSPIAKVIVPEDFNIVVSSITDSAQHLTPWHCEYRVQLPGQPIRWMDGRSTPEKQSDGSIIWHGFNTDITERKQAEEKILESEAQFRSLFDNSPVGKSITAIDGSLLVINESFCKIVGYSNEELKTKKYLDISHPDDILKTIEVRQLLLDGKSSHERFEKRFIHKNGNIVWADLSTYLQQDKTGKPLFFISTITDITERKKAEEALHQSEKNYRMLFDQMTSGLAVHEIILDTNNNPVDYRFLQVNSAFEKLTGLRAKDIIGKTVMEVLPKTESSFVKRYGEVALTGKDIQFESYSQEINKYFNIRAYAPERGKFATVFEDITERKQTEDALAKEQFIMNMLMDNVPDRIYFKDKESRFIRMNKALATTFGLADPSEALGKTDFDFFTEQHALPAFEDEQKIMRTGQSIIGLEEMETWPDGSMTWANTTKMPLRDKKGEIIGTFGISKDITTRKRAEEELSRSEEKYRSIFENVQDVYYEAAIDGTIFECSPSIEIMSKGQYKRENLIGKSMYNFYSDVEQRETLLKLLHEQGIVSDFEVSLKNRDGSSVPCAISSKVCFDAEGRPLKIIGSMRDITERKQAEEMLRETRDYLENLLSFANAPIIVWDPKFKITRFNLAFEKVTGYTVYEVVGKHLEMLFPVENRKQSLSLIAPTSEGDHLITIEIPILCKNGSIRIVLWSTANIYAADGQTLVSTIAQGQDITEQKKLQQELLQSQKMQSIGTLAGGIAHDFNNILGIILGYSSFIERENLNPEKLHESIGIIKNAVGRGAALVGQILTFARKTDVVFQPLNVTVLIHELLSMLKQTFPKIITFIERLDKNISYIDADKTQIHQILLNLCVNARDAMPNGGTITIKTERQPKSKVQERIPAADQDSYICISVTDTGEGMSEAIRRQIFDPFFTTKEQGKGTGLGLAVVYGAVQSHHGFIDVESEVGRGTTFRLYFPVPLASEQSSGVTVSTESFATGGTETILFIEDEEALKEIVHLLLESNGYKVFTAQDGNEAIKEYNQHKQEIDIVLTDMGLPGMTGMDVFKKLKEINPNVKVIVASGFLEPNVKSELDKTGAKGFIQKPYSPDEVLRKLREVLDKKKHK